MRQKYVAGFLTFMMMAVFVLSACGTDKEKANEKAVENTGATKKNQVVNVFTARHYDIDFSMFDEFEKQTGIVVNEIKGTAEELVERMKREGASSEADLFITVDGGVLDYAKSNGVLQKIESEVVNGNVPAKLRDKDNNWVGVATRARVIAYAKDRVKPEQLSTYEALTEEQWKGKVLVRSSSNLYNQSLVASLIALNGEEQTQQWANGMVANFARTPDGGDRDQAKAVVAGLGDVAIMNTYYVGQMLNSKDAEEVKVAQNIGIFFPNQETTGAHLNISGIGLAAHAKNKDNAIKLIEFMTGKEGQEMLTNASFEFPVNEKAEVPALLKEWGEFKTQELDYAKLSEFNKKATELMNKAAWK
ncbi:Fe(3+) ABC transporter substrate-binding protein [Paenibacillus sp. GSMTC-2017]|uniref:Fe(3+) ABC transporter substrate-binding protein n=1 Tax=Paenibacillus sp. GSMTC-2017 TaxID=2794350 RepID=UPI0018D93DF9|nr:Fe(3+) ABC transporter substrate-binding protein [Paenibacillus sp. GSMTC-2017]MBH5317449.1 Fe(3+) ABC transporter substrate-binding protein [Paenibacillus sp. GSMTC-2017]